MWWAILLLFLAILSLIFFQKIQNKRIRKKILEKKVNDNETEILLETEKLLYINLPNKVVDVKRVSKKELFIGQIIFEKYKIMKVIKKGQMSHVYLVKHLVLGNKWCLKLVMTYDSTGLFQEEGFLRQMNHQMIPKMIDVFYEGNLVYIVEEYIEGQALSTLLKVEGQFSEEQLIKWAIELSEIFEYLHEKVQNPIIYRDLKPENIVVTHHRHLVLIDFGLAKYKTSDKKDILTSGTQLFAPKEQFSGQGITDELTDLYSIGMVIIYLILENDSTEVINLKKLTKFVSKDFSKVLLKSVSEKRNRRYQNSKALKNALRNIKGKKNFFR